MKNTPSQSLRNFPDLASRNNNNNNNIKMNFIYIYIYIYILVRPAWVGHLERKESWGVFGFAFARTKACLPRRNKAHSKPSKQRLFSLTLSLSIKHVQPQDDNNLMDGRSVGRPSWVFSNQRGTLYIVIPKLSILKCGHASMLIYLYDLYLHVKKNCTYERKKERVVEGI
jgi:hypothetical protein